MYIIKKENLFVVAAKRAGDGFIPRYSPEYPEAGSFSHREARRIAMAIGGVVFLRSTYGTTEEVGVPYTLD